MKKLAIFFLSFFFVAAVSAQSFRHGVTTGSFIANANGDGDLTVFGTIGYTPRFVFMENENTSLSAGIPLSFGFAGSYSYTYNGNDSYDEYYDNSIRFMINAPAMVDFNWGAGATRETEKRFGLFAGVGFGLHWGDFVVRDRDEYFDDYYNSRTYTTYGPAANMGMRFAVGQNQKNVEVKFSYQRGINKPTTNVFGIVAGFNF